MFKIKYGILFAIASFLYCITKVCCQDDSGKSTKILYPCKGNKNIQYRIPKNQPENEKEKNFYLLVDKKLAANTVINISLILPAEQSLENPSSQYTFISEELIDGVILKEINYYKKWLRTINGKTPFVSSLLINYVQQCQNPGYEYLEYKNVTQPPLKDLLPTTNRNLTCGRRKLPGSGYIFEGFDTKPGDWPWHVALFRLEVSVSKYICGGTLISKSMVLTAAHCVTSQGVPIVTSSLTVALGKYNLFSGNTGEQEKEINKIIVHENFDPTTFANDIALLQLKSEAVYSEYVQPACLWRDGDFAKLPNPQIYGTVVGWGVTQLNQLSLKLKKIKIPKIPDLQCFKSKPTFFGSALNERNFCAGYKNGSSVCNGDSGGGFMVFVPDSAQDKSENPEGSWHVRGITSVGIVKDNVICDPYEYSLFTDVSKYLAWIYDKLDQESPVQ